MAARAAGLDCDPTKLIEIVELGQATPDDAGGTDRFSIANDGAKYFAIIPAMVITLSESGREPERARGSGDKRA
jgi:K+-transporting ATPase ATPase B chain